MDKSKYDVYIGKILDGRYKILELVGIGGMAFVLKSTDLVMNRTVAIKILSEEFNGDEQAEQRFINESKAVAMLSHKNIVNIYDVAIYADMKYIVMEYLDGITLKEYLTRKGHLPWKEAAFYICQILRALDHAHKKGIVHRDIKPQNIMLLRNGEIKVTDFGIAKVPNTEPLTMTDKAIGTVYYISPEQASGKTTGYYSDIYSVGVMFYEAVTGVLPFVATSPVTVAMMQVSEIPKSPSEHMPDLPQGIVNVILKAMEKQPEDRFKSAYSMARVIEEIVQNPDYDFNLDDELEDDEAIGTMQLEQVKPDVEEWDSGIDNDYAKAQKAVEKKLSRDEYKDLDTKLPKRKKKKRASGGSGILPIVSAVFFAFILVVIGAAVAVGYQAYEVYNQGNDVIEVEIPDLEGMIWNEELEQELLEKNIKVKVKTVDKGTETANEIVYQNPRGGVTRNLTSDIGYIEISIEVTMGEQDVIVPDVTITEWREATTTLEKLGLVPIKYEYYSPTIISGYVISTEPAAGETLKTGDVIKIYVSKGQDVKKVAMPALVNKTEEEAKRLITEYNLVVGKIEYEPTGNQELDGLVAEQSTIEGVLVPEYSTIIDLVVYKYDSTFSSETAGDIPVDTVDETSNEPTDEPADETVDETNDDQE